MLSLSTSFNSRYSSEKLVYFRDPGSVAFSTNEKAAGRVFRASAAHDNGTEIQIIKEELSVFKSNLSS